MTVSSERHAVPVQGSIPLAIPGGAAGAFRVESAGNGIAHLVMDDPGRRVNLLDEAAFASLETALTQLEQDPSLRGVIVISGKPGTFVAGADVHAIGSITDPEQVRAIVRRAHVALNRLAYLHAPTVAAIDGVCLGGGTELALACDSRIASEESRTQIGLPEVLLGIFPGFGGTTRLPRLIGLQAALDLILTGRTLDARRAERMGLIARAVPAAWLVEFAHRRIEELQKRPRERRRDSFRARGMAQRFLEGWGRGIVFNTARRQTLERTGGHYPAPIAAIGVLSEGLGQPVERALALEERIADLVVSPECKNLIRIFLLSERTKKEPPVPGVDLEPATIDSLALVGAGVMGGGIAELASRSGIRVRVRDLKPEALTHSLQTVKQLIDERSRRRRMPRHERDGQMSRISVTTEPDGFGTVDGAIEAVVEDLAVKRRVFAELETRMRPEALLASNTSSLSVSELGAGLAHPGRFCGFHFFNPVHRMPLVEVVRGIKTTDATMVTAVALARRLGKTPVVVADSPGFVVNRVLMPYLREAMHLLEEGYSLTDIDASMRNFGMPMGPFEVIDEVGLDVAQKVAGVLGAAFSERMSPAPMLDKLVAAGRLGKKTGAGFYRHRGRRRRPDSKLPGILGLSRRRGARGLTFLSERMTLAIINEAAWCLDEGVVSDPGMVDVAMIFGAGFPPFRGGPLRYGDALGAAHVAGRLTALRAERGERYRPAERIVRRAETGGKLSEN